MTRDASLKKAVVFLGRSLAQRRKAIPWIDFIERYGQAMRLGQPPLELVRKSLSTYFLHRRPIDWTRALLMTHFEICRQVVGRETLAALWQGKTIELSRLEGRRDSYWINLCRADQAGARHEGELTLSLNGGPQQARLYRMTFIFVEGRDGGVSLAVGGMQGPDVGNGKRALVDATRDLGGLRPKDALLLVLKGLAFRLGAREIYGVANALHIINRRRQHRRELLHTDYDSYWRDRGGSEGSPFGFILPVEEFDSASAATSRREATKFACWRIGTTPF